MARIEWLPPLLVEGTELNGSEGSELNGSVSPEKTQGPDGTDFHGHQLLQGISGTRQNGPLLLRG